MLNVYNANQDDCPLPLREIQNHFSLLTAYQPSSALLVSTRTEKMCIILLKKIIPKELQRNKSTTEEKNPILILVCLLHLL